MSTEVNKEIFRKCLNEFHETFNKMIDDEPTLKRIMEDETICRLLKNVGPTQVPFIILEAINYYVREL